MILHALTAHALSISVALNVLLTLLIAMLSISRRSWNRKCALTEHDLAARTAELQGAQADLKRANDFIEEIQPFVRRSAGDAADFGAHCRYWMDKALLFWQEIREQSAARQREAKFEFGYKIVEALLSHFVPHPKPFCAR